MTQKITSNSDCCICPSCDQARLIGTPRPGSPTAGKVEKLIAERDLLETRLSSVKPGTEQYHRLSFDISSLNARIEKILRKSKVITPPAQYLAPDFYRD